MDKIAKPANVFKLLKNQSLKGKLRTLKRVATLHPEGAGAVAGGVAGYGGGVLLTKKIKEYGLKSKNPKERAEAKKLNPYTTGLLFAPSGAMIGLAGAGSSRMGRKAFDHHFNKAWRGTGARRHTGGRKNYNGTGRGGGEAPKAKVKDTGVPEWLKGIKTKDQAKKAYRAQAMKHHPDRGGDGETIKKINNEWDSFQKHHFHKLSHVMASFFDELSKINEAR